MTFPVAALAAVSSFVAPTGRCINPPVPTRTVSPTAQEKIDAPVVAAVAAMAVAGVVLPDVGQLDSGFQYDSWAATAVAIPATICILIPFFGAVEVQEGSEALRMGMATKFAPTAASAASLSAGPWALLTNAARDAVKTDNVLMAKARAAMALSAEQAEEEERCVSPQLSLPPCHPIARVSTHSRAVLPSHDTFFTVDEDDGMACVEVTHTHTHARPHPATLSLPLLASSSRRTTASCSGSVCDARARPDLGQHPTAPATLPDSVSHYHVRLRPWTLCLSTRAQGANRLLPHACVVLEKNREVELCEFCQIDLRVNHIDEICVERRWRESYDAWGC